MISSINNSPNFTGIVPVRVFVDGERTFEPKLVKSAVRQLTSTLATPQKNIDAANLFSKFDPQYRKSVFAPKTKPSDFFKLIIDKYRGIFLATGEQTRHLNKLGKNINIEKMRCRERRVDSSLDLQAAKNKYGDTLSTMLSSAQLRLCEISDVWHPVTLNISIKNKKLEKVQFTST